MEKAASDEVEMAEKKIERGEKKKKTTQTEK